MSPVGSEPDASPALAHESELERLPRAQDVAGTAPRVMKVVEAEGGGAELGDDALEDLCRELGGETARVKSVSSSSSRRDEEEQGGEADAPRLVLAAHDLEARLARTILTILDTVAGSESAALPREGIGSARERRTESSPTPPWPCCDSCDP